MLASSSANFDPSGEVEEAHSSTEAPGTEACMRMGCGCLSPFHRIDSTGTSFGTVEART